MFAVLVISLTMSMPQKHEPIATFPFEPTIGIRIPAQISDRKCIFVLDADASLHAFDTSLTELIGPTTGSVAINGTPTPYYMCPVIKMDLLQHQSRLPCVTMNLEGYRSVSGSPLMGALGSPFLLQYDVLIDVDSKRLCLFRAGEGWMADPDESLHLQKDSSIIIDGVQFGLDSASTGDGEFSASIFDRFVDTGRLSPARRLREAG